MQERKWVSVIVWLTLVIIATVLVSIIGLLWFIFELIISIFKWWLWDYLYKVAVSLDQMWNTLSPRLLDMVFKKWVWYKFWHEDETVSSVLWRNKMNWTLTWFGKFIDNILEKLDPNHSIESIDTWEDAPFWKQ